MKEGSGWPSPGVSSALCYLQWDEKRVERKSQKSRGFKKTETLQISTGLPAVQKQFSNSQVDSGEKLRRRDFFISPKKGHWLPPDCDSPRAGLWLVRALPHDRPTGSEGDSPAPSVPSFGVMCIEWLRLLVCTRAGGTLGPKALLLVCGNGSPPHHSWSWHCSVRAGKHQSWKVAA